ncbi:cysteinyl leukotriene receptor 2-like [Amia ocellicauda]|uniref:cysteinyl leukotriene receptor 2-like n=1 Tax=Amia ocellicauda TaxID=2972642 RepID=UPI003463EBEF
MPSPALSEANDAVSFLVMPLVYALVFGLGLPGNIMALLVFSRDRKWLKKAVRVYLINLTVADLLFNLTLPFWVSYYARGGHWLFGEVSCRLVGSLYYLSTYCTITFMTLISLDRYCTLRTRWTRLPMLRQRGATVLCILIWAFWLSGAIPTLTMQQGFSNNPGQKSQTKCFESMSQEHVYSLVVCTFFAVSFLIVLLSYVSIIWSLGMRQDHRVGSHRLQAKAMVLGMLLVFLLCVAPFHITLGLRVLLTWDDHAPYAMDILHRINTALLSINSCIDPFIYCFSLRHFRSELRVLWQDMGQALLHTPSAARDTPSHRQPALGGEPFNVLKARFTSISTSTSSTSRPVDILHWGS